jgi:hypothetical protein
MAEPAIGGSNLIRFDENNSNQNNTLPMDRPFPIVIPTTDNNVTIVSSTQTNTISPNETIRESINEDDGTIEKNRISNITQNGFITLFGNYKQNSVDIPKFNLSSIVVINDEDVTFKFILCLKDGESSQPTLYATSNFYNQLLQAYGINNPIPVNYLINERKIVVIDIQPLKQKIEDLRVTELNLDINLSNQSDKEYVKVIRNLFAISNYQADSITGLKANPTYIIIELLKYISWVVSKPAQNYNNRILTADTLGQWGEIETEQSSETSPSTNVSNIVDDNNIATTPPLNIYPPIGRLGISDEEEVFYNGKLYIWDSTFEEWVENRGDDSDRQFR